MQTDEKIGLILFAGAVVGVFVLEICVLTGTVLRRLKKTPRPKRRPAGRVAAVGLHVVAGLGVLCVLYAFFVEPYWIEITHVDIPTEKLAATEFIIVQISDLHCDPTRRNEDEVVRIINEIRPDIVVFTGDAVNDRAQLPAFRETLAGIEAGVGKFAVRGNFDVNHSAEELVGGTGFELLDNRGAVVEKNGERIFVAGVRCRKDYDMPGALRDAPVGMFCVLLHHYPHRVLDEPVGAVDLSLCGHVHGGQIALPFYGAIVTLSPTGKKYERGAYRIGATLLYVNRGIGMESDPAPRMRFCARPEITVFRVRPADGQCPLPDEE